MGGDDMRKVRRSLGLSPNQFARVLRLKPANGRKSVKDMEAGRHPIGGPTSLVVEALRDGWRPRDYAENAREIADDPQEDE